MQNQYDEKKNNLKANILVLTSSFKVNLNYRKLFCSSNSGYNFIQKAKTVNNFIQKAKTFCSMKYPSKVVQKRQKKTLLKKLLVKDVPL